MPLFANHHIRFGTNQNDYPTYSYTKFEGKYYSESYKNYRNMDFSINTENSKHLFQNPFIRVPGNPFNIFLGITVSPFPILCKENTPMMKPSYYIWYDEDTKLCMRCDPKSNCKTCQKTQPKVCLTCWGEDILNTEGDNTCMAPTTIIDNHKYLMEYEGYGSDSNDFSAKDILPLKVEDAFNSVT